MYALNIKKCTNSQPSMLLQYALRSCYNWHSYDNDRTFDSPSRNWHIGLVAIFFFAEDEHQRHS